MLNAVMTARLDPETRADLARQYREDQSDSWSAARAAGLSAGVAEWLVMYARREQYRVAYRDFFRDWDVLLAPITLRNAFAHVDMSWPALDSMRHVQLDVDGRPTRIATNWCIWVLPPAAGNQRRRSRSVCRTKACPWACRQLDRIWRT